MGFWTSTLSNALAGILAALFIVLLYILIQWFLRVTHLLITYNWRFETVNGITSFRPNFDIRNRSGRKAIDSQTLRTPGAEQSIGSITSLCGGAVLEPGSINNRYQVAPVRDVHSAQDALGIEITIRTQGGRSFWLRGQGPGQMGKGRIQRVAFWLRSKLDSTLIPMDRLHTYSTLFRLFFAVATIPRRDLARARFSRRSSVLVCA